MMRNRLFAAVVAALVVAPAVQAQDEASYDDRWYVAPRLGAVIADNKRGVDDTWLFGFGIGKYLSPNWAMDIEYTFNEFDFDDGTGDWTQNGLGVSFRRFFRDSSEAWRPYAMFGAGGLANSADRRDEQTPLEMHFGGGLDGRLNDRLHLRTEIGYRYDMDDTTVANQDDFDDWIVSVGLTVALGTSTAPAPYVEPEPEPYVAPEPEPEPQVLDADRDNVPDDRDACPDSQPGQMIGPDGCPADVTIDLRGVNFEFDKAVLLPESMATLDQAVDVLKRFNTISVEVAGHTDSVGTDAYNQKLSESRAKVVYDYLVANGIDASRLSWTGYGEGSPLTSNETAEGRAANRRTELVIQK